MNLLKLFYHQINNMDEVQLTYEKIVSLCSTNDLCYRKQMEQYRSYIEQNFSVQCVLEFPEYEYWASRPVTKNDIDILNNYKNNNEEKSQ